MFNAIFRHQISIRNPSDARRSEFRCGLKFECEIPFKPREGDCFYIGEDEEDAQVVHYDIGEGRFNVVCGGSLCESEDDAQESIARALSQGWTIEREKTAS